MKGGFLEGEPLFITDEQRFAIATGPNSFQAVAKQIEGTVSNYPIAFTCERNAGPTAVGQLFALGNGATTAGIIMPYAGKVYEFTFGAYGYTSGQTATLQIAKNGVGQGASYQLSITGTGAAILTNKITFGTPLSFVAGDALNVISTAFTATAPTGSVCMFIVKYD